VLVEDSKKAVRDVSYVVRLRSTSVRRDLYELPVRRQRLANRLFWLNATEACNWQLVAARIGRPTNVNTRRPNAKSQSRQFHEFQAQKKAGKCRSYCPRQFHTFWRPQVLVRQESNDIEWPILGSIVVAR
jgi:transposase